MDNDQHQPCGHHVRYIVQEGEGTAFCAVCEYAEAEKRAAELYDLVRRLWVAGEIAELPEAA